MDEDVEIDEHEFHLNHVILPRFLEPQKPGYGNQLKLMNKMLQCVFDTPIIPPPTMDLFKQFHRLHVDTTTDNFNNVLKEQIKTLLTDETFAMFVRRQNCTLMIHKQRDSTIVATFRGDMKSSEVYYHESDIEVNFL